MRFLGPVFWYDLVHIARRQRLALWRAAYGLALLAALFLLYTNELPQTWLAGGHLKPDQAAAFAGQFFAVFVALQFAAVVLLTPALTANALAEEKGRNTLVFLLTTQLTNREIVLGKMWTRLLQVGLLVLTGLPVLGLLQFMGGVEPVLVPVMFAGLALTGLSLGSLGMACAVFVKKPQNAAWRAYQIILLIGALSAVSIWYWNLPFGRTTGWTFTFAGGRRIPVMTEFLTPPEDPTLFQQGLETINLVNPYFAYLRIYYEQAGGTLLNDIVWRVLRDYALVHGAFALCFAGLAVWRLRAVSAKQSAGLTHKKARVLKPAPHPPVRERPVLWKEIYCEAKPRQRWLSLFFSRWFYWTSFLPTWVVLMLLIDNHFGRLTEYMGIALSFGGTLVAAGLCVRVGLHAARSIGSERDRLTLDCLLTTDLSPAEIVRDKWWGSLLTGRWVLLWLVIHWALGAMVMALDLLAIPLLALECAVYGAFFVSLGLYCAARCATTRQAVTVTLLAGVLGTSLLPWAGGKLMKALLPFPTIGGQTDYFQGFFPTRTPYYAPDRKPLQEDTAIGLTPAWVLYESVFPNRSFMSSYRHDRVTRIVYLAPWIFIGLGIYAAAAFVLARMAADRFHRSVRGWQGNSVRSDPTRRVRRRRRTR